MLNDSKLGDLEKMSLKSDMISLEMPIFALAKCPDFKSFEWISVDAKRSLIVIPSTLYGRATIFDYDVLIYAISVAAKRLHEGYAQGLEVQFTAHEYLRATGRGAGGKDYQALDSSLSRLSTTTIQTNIANGGRIVKSFFHLLDVANFVVGKNGRVQVVKIKLSDWIYSAINTRQMLSIDPSYFSLGRPLERKIYQISRKHIGDKGVWKIGIEKLLKKTGSRTSAKEFKRELNKVIARDEIPNYRLRIEGDIVVVYVKDQTKLASSITGSAL